MASIKDKNGYKEIQYLDRDRKRRSLYAGKISKRNAESIGVKIEAIVSRQVQGYEVDPDLSHWLAGLSNSFYSKLVKLGLCEAREAEEAKPTLKAWTDSYIEKHTGKPATIEQLKMSAKGLCDFFGDDRLIDDIHAGDAEDFRRSLEKRKLATNTIRRRIGRAKQFFSSAIKHRLITENPFQGEASTVGANPERMLFVPAEWIEHLIRETDCEDMKIIVAMARYGGLRSHETRIQKWEDIDLVKGRMLIRSNKSPAVRCCPIFPELRPHLMRAKEMAPDGATMLQNRYKPEANPLTTLRKIIEKTGLKPWPKLLQNLRASRETELLGKYPAKDVTSWLGNSPTVAHKHYAMATDDTFAKALIEKTISPTPHRTPHKTPQTAQERGSQSKTDKRVRKGNSAIHTGKDVIRLDLSYLGESGAPLASCPTRT
ncbi:tyrosine-type recombinase/integrase [Novipirellula artificiosorum]|uniref:tyrosine-type recombinase/integrase n=1 Tax=Novipirellula artificiosorum TaxID=2528016 RepID=UPI0011B7BC32|nr:site-specific integrase [Novipirellula artificiosorum]